MTSIIFYAKQEINFPCYLNFLNHCFLSYTVYKPKYQSLLISVCKMKLTVFAIFALLSVFLMTGVAADYYHHHGGAIDNNNCLRLGAHCLRGTECCSGRCCGSKYYFLLFSQKFLNTYFIWNNYKICNN